MLVDTSESLASEEYEVSEAAVDEQQAEQSPKDSAQSPKDIDQAAEPTGEEDSDDERRFWLRVEVIGKIRDCTRLIEDMEEEIGGYQASIKEAKELLKGQQALLARYSSQLADIVDGKPLPKDPNAPEQASDAEVDEAAPEDGDWRSTPTDKLLKDLPGLGKRKMELLLEVAPNAGKLESLRGEASMAHKRFKEVLPNGFGETLTDLMEDRLVEHVAKYSQVADEPVADREYEDVEDETDGTTDNA